MRSTPSCVRCGDAGWFTALLRSNPSLEYSFRCSCPAAEAMPATTPVWRDDADSPRYRRVSAMEIRAGATVESIRRALVEAAAHEISKAPRDRASADD